MNKLKERMKRSLKSILSIGAAILCSISAWAEEWTDASGNVWTYSGGKITGVSFETTNLVMPETLGGNLVTSFASKTFAGKERAVHVTIPATVTSIPAGAFAGCSNLKSVTINGTGLKSIGATAFKGCSNLEAFVMPHSVETVGQGVFSGCTLLESITLSDKLETLPGVLYSNIIFVDRVYYHDGSGTSLSGDVSYGFFYNCTSLKTINWGKGIKSIGNLAFLNCSALESITIPDTITTIGYHAFLGCNSVRRIIIGNEVTEIGRMAFCSLPNLTKVTFGDKVNKIGYRAFEGCVNLQDFTLPATIQYIETFAFAGCNKALTTVTIPTNKDELETKLGMGVFSGCSKLTTVTLGDTVKLIPDVLYSNIIFVDRAYYHDDSGTSLSGDVKYGFFYNCTSLKTINWGKGIKSIGNLAFLNCSALESITIPDTVTKIGYHAFLGCNGVSRVIIGNEVTEIGRMAFCSLPNLTKVTFGDKVNKIGYRAFEGCVNLQDFTLPATIQYIETFAFAGCNKALTTVTIPTNKDELETELGLGVFSGCSKLTTVTLGDTVKLIPDVLYSNVIFVDRAYYHEDSGTSLSGNVNCGFFYNCTSLKTINWGAGIKSIGNIAFLNCSALTDVTLPESIDTIGNHAFYGCSSLKAVVAEGSINSIGRRAFGNCPALHYVDFRGSVMDFAPGAEIFAFCNDRATVYAADGSTGWTGVAGVTGLPSNGTWGGARITYAPPPEGAGNPYDFYPYTLTDRINRTDYTWSSPVLLTTNRYVNGSTIPTTSTTIREGSPIYLSYAFNEYWRGEAFTVTNRFTLSGAKSGTFDYSSSWEAHANYTCGWKTNATPALLQNLAPGNYTLTLTVNGDNRLAESDTSNNGASVAFTIVGSPRYTVSFNLNGASGTAPSVRSVIEGSAIGELPTITAPAGWTFLGWYTAATGGTKIASTTVVNSAFTCYAQWAKRDMGFYTPSSLKWAQPLFVATSGSAVSGTTQFKKGERIYVKYAFANLAGNYDLSGFINRFTLTGAKSATFDDDWRTITMPAGNYGFDGGNWYPAALQNLPAGSYTLTCTLDATNAIAETNEGNNTRSITFTVVANDSGIEPPSPPPPSPPPSIKPEIGVGDYSVAGDKLEGTAPETAASVYDGYLYLKNTVVGTIQAKVSKPKLNKKLNIATAKTSVTIQINGEKKVSLKDEINLANGQFIATDKKSDRTLILNLGLDGISGTFGKYDIDGARNFFDSKDKTEKSIAEAILKPYLGAYSMSCDGGILSVTIAKKGKVTIKGSINGNKVSAKAQALIGEKMICIPVIYSKKSVNLAFTIWLPISGGNAKIIGLDGNPVIGKAGKLNDGAEFIINGDIGADIGTEKDVSHLLPDGEIITVSKSKWLVADGAKPAKVAFKDGEFNLTPGKKGEEPANPSGLKLSYKSKDGSFSGSFTAYAIVKGKLKKHKATVEGVLIGNVGYGTITIKKIGTWDVTIK